MSNAISSYLVMQTRQTLSCRLVNTSCFPAPRRASYICAKVSDTLQASLQCPRLLLSCMTRLLTRLTIVCVCTMLTIVMLILEFLRCRLDAGIDGLCTISHLCHLFQYHCVMYCVMSILAPCERTVVLAKHCRHCHRILVHALEFIHD